MNTDQLTLQEDRDEIRMPKSKEEKHSERTQIIADEWGKCCQLVQILPGL